MSVYLQVVAAVVVVVVASAALECLSIFRQILFNYSRKN
jgi:hypothetical protein